MRYSLEVWKFSKQRWTTKLNNMLSFWKTQWRRDAYTHLNHRNTTFYIIRSSRRIFTLFTKWFQVLTQIDPLFYSIIILGLVIESVSYSIHDAIHTVAGRQATINENVCNLNCNRMESKISREWVKSTLNQINNN